MILDLASHAAVLSATMQRLFCTARFVCDPGSPHSQGPPPADAAPPVLAVLATLPEKPPPQSDAAAQEMMCTALTFLLNVSHNSRAACALLAAQQPLTHTVTLLTAVLSVLTAQLRPPQHVSRATATIASGLLCLLVNLVERSVETAGCICAGSVPCAAAADTRTRSFGHLDGELGIQCPAVARGTGVSTGARGEPDWLECWEPQVKGPALESAARPRSSDVAAVQKDGAMPRSSASAPAVHSARGSEAARALQGSGALLRQLCSVLKLLEQADSSVREHRTCRSSDLKDRRDLKHCADTAPGQPGCRAKGGSEGTHTGTALPLSTCGSAVKHDPGFKPQGLHSQGVVECKGEASGTGAEDPDGGSDLIERLASVTAILLGCLLMHAGSTAEKQISSKLELLQLKSRVRAAVRAQLSTEAPSDVQQALLHWAQTLGGPNGVLARVCACCCYLQA